MCKAVEEYGKACAIRTQIEAVKNLMTNLQWTIDQAMQALNISQEDQIVIKGMLK